MMKPHQKEAAERRKLAKFCREIKTPSQLKTVLDTVEEAPKRRQFFYLWREYLRFKIKWEDLYGC